MASDTSGQTKQVSKPNRTFYRRNLPCPPAIAFASDEGRKIFRESLSDGYMEGYFILSEQFRTQDEPSFCGISTLTMVLNTLAIDPKRIWKGAWRWYNESMLECCIPLSEVKASGIDFDQFVCLAKCNSLKMIKKRPNQKHIYSADKNNKTPTIQPQNNNSNDNVVDITTDENKENANVCCTMNDKAIIHKEYYTIDEFRNDVIVCCMTCNAPIVIVSYSRKGLSQTGDGHFSPIGGYNKQKDLVLVLDVARYKYPPHWVPLELLYNAMCRIDKTTNKTRGWIVSTVMDAMLQPAFFTFDCEINEMTSLNLHDNLCCCSDQVLSKTSDVMGDINDSNDKNDKNCLCNTQSNGFSAEEVIKCLLLCLPKPIDSYLTTQCAKFKIKMDDIHGMNQKKLTIGIQATGLFGLITKIFEDNANKSMIAKLKLENRDKLPIEIVTLMVLVIGHEVWSKLANENVSKELVKLTAIDESKYADLSHEVIALRSQIAFLKDFLISMYKGHIK